MADNRMSQFDGKLARYRRAACALDTMGSQPPEDHEQIELEFKQARKDLRGYVKNVIFNQQAAAGSPDILAGE